MASSGRMRCLPLSFYNIHNFTSVLLDTSIGKGLERMNARLMIKALWFIYSEDTSTGRCQYSESIGTSRKSIVLG